MERMSERRGRTKWRISGQVSDGGFGSHECPKEELPQMGPKTDLYSEGKVTNVPGAKRAKHPSIGG